MHFKSVLIYKVSLSVAPLRSKSLFTGAAHVGVAVIM